MKQRSGYSLRMTLMVLILALIALTWISVIRMLLLEWNHYSVARETVWVNEQVERILQAGQNLAFERGRTNVLLNASGPADAKNLEFIASRREAVDTNLALVLSLTGVLNHSMARQVQYEYAGLRKLRQDADQALALPKSARQLTLADRWFESTSTLIGDLGELVTQLSLMNANYTASFRNFSRMKILAFHLRVQLGVEASRIAAMVSAGKVPTQLDLERLQNLRGNEAALWDLLRQEGQISDNQSAKKGIDRIEQDFFSSFRPIQDRVLNSLRDGKASPVSSEELTAASVPALDSIGKLLSILSAESDARLIADLGETKHSFAFAFTFSALALFVGLIALFIAVFRFFLPLKKIGALLMSLAGGDVSVDIPDHVDNSETEEVYSALRAVRDSLVDRQTLEAKLISLSNVDGLTGLSNRRCLDDTLVSEWNRAARSGTPLAIAMFDVDYFKNYNDRYGHLAGDECLKRVAAIFLASLHRPGDLAARFGGEEFVAVLPGLNPDQCRDWSEAVKQEAFDLNIANEGAPTGRLTVSAGAVSVIPAKEGSVLEILRIADECLYRAKAAGRNRVVLAE